METSVFCVDGELRPRRAVEMLEEARRPVYLFIAEMSQLMSAKEVEYGADDAGTFSPTPLLDQVVTASYHGAAVGVETGGLSSIFVVNIEHPLHQPLRHGPSLERRSASELHGEHSVLIELAERQQPENGSPEPLNHGSIR